MNKNYLFLPVAIAAFGLFAFQKTGSMIVESYVETHLQSGGGQAGYTGAPGDATCVQCHTGSTLDGTTENQFTLRNQLFTPVTEYLPGESYTAELVLASDPSKKGFSATAFDGTNSMAGNFTEIFTGGTQDFSVGGKDYVSHTSTSNTSAQTTWQWIWDAPATNVGDVTFYIASNVTNNNGNTSGDQIYLSTHTITVDPIAGVSQNEIEASSFEAGYSPSSHTVIVDFNSLTSDDMYFNMLDLNGKSVFTYDLDDAMIGDNHELISLPQSLKNGIYVVHFFVGNKAMSANVMVQR